jgi:hypothetical protein
MVVLKAEQKRQQGACGVWRSSRWHVRVPGAVPADRSMAASVAELAALIELLIVSQAVGHDQGVDS